MSQADHPIRALRQVRISDQIADEIIRYIAEGRLSPGDALPSENEWSRILGVSRPAVREATNALAGRGLIHVATGKAPTVLSLSEGPFSTLVNHGLATGQVTMVQVLEVRRGLEDQAAMLAACRRTTEDIGRIEATLSRLNDSLGDVEVFSSVDMAFHRAIARATGNMLLSCVMAGMADAALESSRTGLHYALHEAEWTEILKLHRDVAAAIILQDAESARMCMRAHFDSALARLRRGSKEDRHE